MDVPAFVFLATLMLPPQAAAEARMSVVPGPAPACQARFVPPSAILTAPPVCRPSLLMRIADNAAEPEPSAMAKGPVAPKAEVAPEVAAACPTDFMPPPKVQEALGRCEALIATLAPGSQTLADALAGKGFLQFLSGDESAAATLEQSLAIDPKNRIALIWMVESRFRRGEIAEARADVERILSLYPDDPRARRHFAQLMAIVGSPEDTLAAIDKVLEVAPDDLMMHHQRADLLTKLGRGDEALAELDLMIDSVPNAGFALAARADIELELGHAEAAIADIGKAKQTGFMSGGIDLSLARANLMLGRFDAALNAVGAAMSDPQADRENPLLPLYHFVVLDQLGRKAEAEKALAGLAEGRNDTVLRIQVFLRNMGMDRVEITGRFDDKTKEQLTACLMNKACGGPMARVI